MDRWKAEMERVREKRRVEERREEERRWQKRKSQKKEDAGARKGKKVTKHRVFPMICGSGGSKSRLAKAAGAEPSGQMRDEKLHAVVARSTSWSQHVQNTPFSDHFWKLRCRKSAAPLLSGIWIYCGKSWAPNTRLQNLYPLLQNQLICTKHVYENQIARAADFAVVAGFAA